MLLSGLWYLSAHCSYSPPADEQKSAGGDSQSADPDLRMPGGPKDDSTAAAEKLFRGWLRFLGGSPPGLLDLRSAQDAAGSGRHLWAVVEPVSGRIACSLTDAQAGHLASLARLELQKLDAEVGGLSRSMRPKSRSNACVLVQIRKT
ncbi:unnamed protein product [Polarella glacialis]|uniref:Uncharacterized protein n=1 Tax=Polarella glacialis TaxID=89957 RepID=A0A813KPZ5_POLGL|nr:unnamed protein product [Polarella glacialis]CAE8710000.1 unnamed protein product [Polarella glacialis]